MGDLVEWYNVGNLCFGYRHPSKSQTVKRKHSVSFNKKIITLLNKNFIAKLLKLFM